MKALFLFAALSVTSALVSLENSSFKTKVGDKVPAFEYTSVEGISHNISDLSGKVVLLAFFGTKCPPCLRELPEVQAQLVEQLDQQKFEVIAIGPLDDNQKIKDFKAKKQFDFTFVSDKTRDIFDLFAASSLPRTVVIDQNGKIIYQAKGYYKNPFQKMVQLIKTEVAKI